MIHPDDLAALDRVRARLVQAAGRNDGYLLSGRGAVQLRAALVLGTAAATVCVRAIGGDGAEVLLSPSACQALQRVAQQVGCAELRMQLSAGGQPLRVRAVPGARERTDQGVLLSLRYKLTPDQRVALDRMLLGLFNDRGALRVRADPDTPLPVVLRARGQRQAWRGLTLDASLTGLGALVTASTPLPAGMAVAVGLRLDPGAGPSELRGTVVRCIPPAVSGGPAGGIWRVGLRFDESEERVGTAGVGRYVVRRQLAIREHWRASRTA